MVFLRNIPAKLDKCSGGKFVSLNDAKIHQINPPREHDIGENMPWRRKPQREFSVGGISR